MIENGRFLTQNDATLVLIAFIHIICILFCSTKTFHSLQPFSCVIILRITCVNTFVNSALEHVYL